MRFAKRPLSAVIHSVLSTNGISIRGYRTHVTINKEAWWQRDCMTTVW